jgi:hypothetical protein
MTQYIGQITVILETGTPELATESLTALARQLDDISPEVVFADHNGEVDDYEEIERECREAHPSLLPVLLASLKNCAALLADYDEHPGEEGIAYREAIAAIALASGNVKAASDPESDASRVPCAAPSPTNAGLPELFASEPELIQKQLTSSRMVHTPGFFRALRNDYRIKGEPRRRAIKTLSEVYGMPRREAEGLLSGTIRSEIDEAAGTVTYTIDTGPQPAAASR